jgi:hypothetical protein
MPSGWRIIGSGCTALVLLAGAGVIGAVFATRTTDTTTGYAGVARLRVELGDGRLTVRQGGPGVRVRRHLTWSWVAPVVTEFRDGPALTLGASCYTPVSDRSDVVVAVNCTIDYEIEVPPEVELTATSSEGITVDGLTGSIELTCTDGGIVVTAAGGPVIARADAGDVDVVFTSPPASAELTSGTGDVRLLVPAGHDYRVSGSARRITNAVPSVPDATHVLTARSGGALSIGYTPGGS